MTDIIGGIFSGSAGFVVPEFAQHALLEACYLEADRINAIHNSPHREGFQEAVFSAVRQDRLSESADTLGYIIDPSSDSGEMACFRRDTGVVTYNGESY